MITCQVNHYPALEVEPKSLTSDSIPTLTELATLAIYGTALTPHEFCLARDAVLSSEKAVWGVVNGPSTMQGLLNALATPVPPVSSDDLAAPIVHGNLSYARDWLEKTRREPAFSALTARYAEHKARLVEIHDDDVLAYATEQAARIAGDEAAVVTRAENFYRLVGQALIRRQIVVKGYRRHFRDDAHLPKLPPERVALTEDDLCDVLLHDPESNELDINPTYLTAVDLVGEQTKREMSGPLYRVFESNRTRIYVSDLRIPDPNHVRFLLDAIAGDDINSRSSTGPDSICHLPPLPSLACPGRFERQDAPLRLEIIGMVTKGIAPTVDAAALQLALGGRIAGSGTPESRATRLAKQVREIRPDLSARKKSDQTRS